jgi:hypothetical protein
MKQELDKLLCKKYPKMMVNRDKSMMETCMCWGFECGNGWFNILDQLMGNVQHHIDQSEKNRQRTIEHNENLAKMKAGDFTDFERDTEEWKPEYKEDMRERMLTQEPRKIPEIVAQVTLDQVKEKFGTLCFYYSGGDDYIRGLVSMAESMSGVTCEGCGSPAKTHTEGWFHTTCQTCQDERDRKHAEFVTDAIKKDIL